MKQKVKVKKEIPIMTGLLFISFFVLCTNVSVFASIPEKDNLMRKVNEIDQNQQKEITGKVTDTQGQPLPGVTVTVKGTTRGTVTDVDGNYSLSNIANNNTLVFSFVGMETQEINVGNRTRIDVTMQESAIALEEVVAVGYGTMKKSDLTGAVSSINQDVFDKSRESSFLKSLQGKIAGVHISTGSGEPGSYSRVIIRGANTIAGSSEPLYVIDGIQINESGANVANPRFGANSPINPLTSINPSDIVSIEVLKDASATAIYGSRGANGVILVTTKQGKEGKPIITYDGNGGISYPAKKIDVLNGSEWIDYRKDWTLMPDKKRIIYGYFQDYLFFLNAGETEPSKMIPRDVYALPEYNWQDEMYRTAPRNSHTLSISGGNINTKFYGSIGYNNEKGLLKNNGYSRYNANLKIDHNQNRVNLSFSLRASYSRYEGAAQSGDGYNNMGILQTAVVSRPLVFNNPRDEEVMGGWKKPTENLLHVDRLTSSPNISSSASMSYKLIEGLYLGTSISGTIVPSRTTEFYGKETPWGYYLQGRAAVSNSEWFGWSNTNSLSYEKNFKNNSRLNILGAFELNGSGYSYNSIVKSNFPDETTGVNDLNKGLTLQSADSNAGLAKSMSFFGRINYNWRDRYLLTSSIRRDGSDRFGEDSRWGYFPSMALAWRISEESFMKRVKNLDNLKLRISYGVTGNSNIPEFRYMARMGNSFYGDQLGLVPVSMPNPNLKWETTVQYNAGLDISVFKNAINLTVDIYNKQTSDMLYEAIIPAQSGFKTQWQNLGKINNKGIEVSLNTININTKDFAWTTSLTLSSNKNKLVEIRPGLEEAPIGAGYWSLSYIKINDVGRLKKGQPIGIMYGYQLDGIYQLNDFSGWIDKRGISEPNNPDIPWEQRGWVLKQGIADASNLGALRPGTFKFKNTDGSEDLKITEADKTVIGNSEPKLFGGFNTNFTFKRFEVGLFFDYSVGGDIFNSTKFELEGAFPGEYYNITKDFWKNHWSPDNPTNKYPSYSDRGYYNSLATQPNSYYVEDGSYFRLQNLSFSYTFPTPFSRKLGVNNFRVYYSISNLFTLTNYTGFSPEVDSGYSLLTGFDTIGYPRPTSHMWGISITL